jgi:prolipoprotein diacylglyceryltransferase
MYPNLYYVFKDWFGVEWHALSLLNTFGLMVAISFVCSAYVLHLELKRKEMQGLLHSREESVMVGEGASIAELLMNFLLGFLFGFKILGALLDKDPAVSFQTYLFSGDGSVFGGMVLGSLMAFLRWREKKKKQLPKPEKRIFRIWPHDRVGDIVVLAMIFGILGAKLFDNLENFDAFIADPIGHLFSASGLTFYGGLIVAAIAICIYAYRKGIAISHLTDAAAPALMLAYALGRIGCQVSGDGDWGVYNKSFTCDEYGHVMPADPDGFQKRIAKDSTYFLEGKVPDGKGNYEYVTDRTYGSLQEVPAITWRTDWLPGWFFASCYAQNVNKDGVIIPGITDEHNRRLPQPVIPTPMYETIICLLFFGLLWGFRKSIRQPWLMFGLYLILNGLERYFIEKVRVNDLYNIAGMQFSQASLIAVMLILSGLVIVLFNRKSTKVS